MWINRLVRYLIPFEMVMTSLILLVVGMGIPGQGGRGVLVLVWLLACVGLPVWVLTITLRTRVGRDAIRVSFRPFPGVRIPVRAVVSAEYRSLEPMRDLGGVGAQVQEALRDGAQHLGERAHRGDA